ncbi:protein kinase domain-containing protein [Sorangium sp. So ce1097]|uniref:serine/threonine-protein kinase n=1 Tax=Sorangium sp. So ce1097 TaxID=3133330 RepID=UPI003F60F583
MQHAPDSVVGGKYRLERPLSRGGMGSVWLARHINLGSPVAVKFMAPTYAASSTFLARFEREARIAANLQSPHVVYVQDYGIDEDTPYLVMELLQGEDLDTRLERVGRLSLADATRVLVQAGKAIRRAHDAGLVHRDLKPANLFLVCAEEEPEEIVKVLDFGIVKETGARLTDEVTRTGELLGSPHYMSPEQVRGEKDVDQRSDLWSLGVILFYAVTGELPFQGDQLGAVIANILVAPLPSASRLAPDLPPTIDVFFARALARDRAQRFQSIGEMMGDLRRLAGMASPSIPDLHQACSGAPTSSPSSPSSPSYPPSTGVTISIRDLELVAPAVPPRSARPGTLTDAGSTAQEAGQQRPSRAVLVLGVAMTVLVGAGVTAAVSQGGPRRGVEAGEAVTPAAASASEQAAARPQAGPQAQQDARPSVTPADASPPEPRPGATSGEAPPPAPWASATPGKPDAAAPSAAAAAPGEARARSSPSATASRPSPITRPRTPRTGVTDSARKTPVPPVPSTAAPEPDRAPIPEVPF